MQMAQKMSERERSRDRPGHQSSTSGSGGLLNMLSYTMFGRNKAPTPRSVSLPESKIARASDDRGRGGAAAGGEGSKRRVASPAPFKSEEVINHIARAEPKDEATAAEVSEYVKAIAVYLVDRATVTVEDEGDGTKRRKDAHHAVGITSADLEMLYIKSKQFANPRNPRTLRTASKRLLAALIAIAPPGGGEGMIAITLPEHISVRSLYQIVTSPASTPAPAALIDEIFVEVGALKALTKNGVQVDDTEGNIGWLVRTVTEMTEEYVAWCLRNEDVTADVDVDTKRKSTPFAPIKPATPPEALTAIIDLISSILSSHAPLITSDDIQQILTPILAVFYKSLAAELKARPVAEGSMMGLTLFHESPMMSAINSPIFMPTLSMESAVRRSVSIKRKPESLSNSIIGTPQSKPSLRQNSQASDGVTSPPYPSSPHIVSPTSPPPISTMAKWTTAFPAFCAFLETLIRSSAIPDETFAQIIALICIALGQLPSEVQPEADQAAANLMAQILAADKSQRAELNIRLILEGSTKSLLPSFVAKNFAIELRMTKGAVSATQVLLQHMEASAGTGDTPSTCVLAAVAPSLRAAQSTSRWKESADRIKWEMVDFAILTLVLDHLNNLREVDMSQHTDLGDAWAEGEAVTEILEGFIPLIISVPNLNLQECKDAVAFNTQDPFSAPEVSNWIQRRIALSHSVSILLPLFAASLLVLPDSIGHLHASTSQSPAFVHPRYIELLLKLGSSLDEADAKTVIDFYVEECLCLPFTTGWIENIWKLLHGFYGPSSQLRQAKSSIAKLMFGEVYEFVEDLPEHRKELVDKVIVPFLEKELLDETDDEFQQAALSVLTRVAVAETMELDDESRSARAKKALAELEDEDAAPKPHEGLVTAATEGSFQAIRGLIIRVATLSTCVGEAALENTVPPPSVSMDRRGPKSRDATPMTGLSKAFAGQISPPTRASPLPAISAVTVPSAPMSPMSEASDAFSPSPTLVAAHNHEDCRSLHAVTSLIAIFSRLAFSPSHSQTSAPRAARTPASVRCITIFRDLLGLLFPMTDDKSSAKVDSVTPKIPARCVRARLVVLQWLMRLRADKRHRVYVRSKLNESAMPFAALLKRTKETESEARAELEGERRRPRPSGGSRLAEEDRGRTNRAREEPTRSRSRSKQPVIRGVDHTYNPLWVLPETLPLDTSEFESHSDCLMTFDPNHPSLHVKGSSPVESVWLPVSEYVRVLNGILRGHDWELVSYVFTFLPLQLRNKAFFHGRRAVQEVRALLDVLYSGIVNTENRWERRYNVPVFIKRFDINGIAYQSLSMLIGYRGVFTVEDCNKLVNAFAAGLESKRELAKPCLQALTLCIFELEPILAKHLVGKGSEDMGILDKLGRIVTTTALAVHILEFLIALGQSGTLYRNFTDEQYRKIFHVAIDYITIHNARSDQPIDLTKFREDYTLSQHVIGLAYYSIYIWFMALKLPQRPNLVPEITRKLLQGRSQRTGLDEMAEVCFDWLARYTYSNADPKPATSFLSEVVMQEGSEADPPKHHSWMLGGAIITITSHARSGWATITTTRPTGATAMVAKLENIPLLELGEANADLVSLPAFLMANRKPDPGSGNLDDPKALAAVKSSVPHPESFNQSSQHGFIWTGATPSQRRKDVLIEPSYLALQLLSSYPNASLETPRGLLIPNEEKFARALRGIQNTPVIDTLKIAVLYVEAGQTTETEILSNVDGSPLYLDFLSGLGRLLRLKGQVDVYVGGLNRDDDSDGEYAYAWWDEFSQMVFHTPTMMPNHLNQPTYDNKKRHIGNDFVKIIYNETGKDLPFDLIKTAFNFVNIIISPLTIGESDIMPGHDAELPAGEEGWSDWDREDWFKVEVQRAPGVPDFGPLGEGRLVSRKALPIMVRQLAYLADGLAKRSKHISEASDAASAEYITNWRSRLRAMARMRGQLPPRELPAESDTMAREELLRDFTRSFSQKPPAPEKD